MLSVFLCLWKIKSRGTHLSAEGWSSFSLQMLICCQDAHEREIYGNNIGMFVHNDKDSSRNVAMWLLPEPCINSSQQGFLKPVPTNSEFGNQNKIMQLAQNCTKLLVFHNLIFLVQSGISADSGNLNSRGPDKEFCICRTTMTWQGPHATNQM